MKDKIISITENYVYNELKGEGSGHDWWHIYRVTELAKRIALEEKADLFLTTMAALLHDIADEKLNPNGELGLLKVKNWLSLQEVPQEDINIILEIISTISFKGGNGPKLTRLEAMVVQDADRLDAIGAIGIARCFTYGGSIGSVIHDPGIIPRDKMTKEEYRQQGTTINHFYEKLLKLKDLMYTNSAKKIAEERHQFMESFLTQFYEEWEGKR